MKKLQVHLFGKLSIRYGSDPMLGFESTKVQELFCYLLLHHEHPQPRTSLASVLWGNLCTTSNSRKYLRNALWRLRAAIGDRPGLSNMLVTDDEWVELRPVDQLWFDVAEFEAAYRLSRKADSFELRPHITAIDKAVRLYTDCLLANWSQDWCVTERDRLHRHYLAMLDRLAGFHEQDGGYDDVLRLAERLLASDPAHERTHRRLMRVYLKTGDRTNALRQYFRCVDALDSELGVGPGPKTQAVLARIQNGDVPVVHHFGPGRFKGDGLQQQTKAAS
ncbi:MAG: bacterial transcriptional activator domain-containing protein [Rhodothermales bacterium]